MPSLFSRNKTFVIAIKNDAEVIKVFYSFPVLPNFITLFQIFRPRLWVRAITLSKTRNINVNAVSINLET